MRKYRWACEQCGGHSLEFQGYGTWNHHNQEIDWEWNETYCIDCGDIVYVKKEEDPPAIPNNTTII